MKGASLDDQTDVAGLGNDLEGLSRPQDGRSGQCIRTNPLARLDTAQSHQPLDGCISTLPERLEQPDLSGSSLDILDPKRLSLPNGTARDPARPVEQDPRFQPDGRTSATVEVDPPPPQVHSGAQAVEISRGEENVASRQRHAGEIEHFDSRSRPGDELLDRQPQRGCRGRRCHRLHRTDDADIRHVVHSDPMTPGEGLQFAASDPSRRAGGGRVAELRGRFDRGELRKHRREVAGCDSGLGNLDAARSGERRQEQMKNHRFMLLTC